MRVNFMFIHIPVIKDLSLADPRADTPSHSHSAPHVRQYFFIKRRNKMPLPFSSVVATVFWSGQWFGRTRSIGHCGDLEVWPPSTASQAAPCSSTISLFAQCDLLCLPLLPPNTPCPIPFRDACLINRAKVG